MFGLGSRSVVLGGKLESRWAMEVVRYGKVSSESLWTDFMALDGGAEWSDLLEFIGHMILARHASMKGFRIHKRRICHTGPVVRSNVELVAQ